MSRSRDIATTSITSLPFFSVIFTAFFSVNFHFLNSDKSCNRDFFTIDTIDDGLSFYVIGSSLLRFGAPVREML